MVEVSTLNLLVGLMIPLLVGLVTKEVTSSGIKGLLNALLSAVAGVLTVVIDNGGSWAFTQDMITVGVNTFLISIAAYYGVYKPTGASQKVQETTSDFGI